MHGYVYQVCGVCVIVCGYAFACVICTSHVYKYICTYTMAYPPACTEQDRLFYVVYEKLSVEGEGMEPHLWTYRSKVSLEHLSHQQDMQSMQRGIQSKMFFYLLVCIISSAPYAHAHKYERAKINELEDRSMIAHARDKCAVRNCRCPWKLK